MRYVCNIEIKVWFNLYRRNTRKMCFFGRDLSPTDKHLPVNKLLKYRSGRYFISFRLKNYLLEYIRNHFDQKKITIKLISDMIGAI